MPNPWILLGVALAWMASLGAVGYWQNDAGRTAERAAWQGKQIQELAAAQKEIVRLNGEARDKEQAQSVELALQAANYEKEREDAEARRRDDVAAARDGALRLRVPGACKQPDPRGTGETPAAPGERHDPEDAELPTALASALLEFANDADEVTRQLGACQATIRTYLSATQGATS